MQCNVLYIEMLSSICYVIYTLVFYIGPYSVHNLSANWSYQENTDGWQIEWKNQCSKLQVEPLISVKEHSHCVFLLGLKKKSINKRVENTPKAFSKVSSTDVNSVKMIRAGLFW